MHVLNQTYGDNEWMNKLKVPIEESEETSSEEHSTLAIYILQRGVWKKILLYGI
jgi:predicted HTH domain antitoxin